MGCELLLIYSPEELSAGREIHLWWIACLQHDEWMEKAKLLMKYWLLTDKSYTPYSDFKLELRRTFLLEE